MSAEINKGKRKLVILSAFYEPFMSGAERMAKEIVERLGHRYDIILVSARLDKTLPKREKRSAFTLERIGIGHKYIDKIIYPLLAALKVRKIKPDIAHAIMESYAGGALVLTKYIYPGARRILTLQSGDLDDKRKQKKFFIKLFFRTIHKAPHKITAISNFLAKRAENLGVKKENILITPNGIDLTSVPSAEQKLRNRVIFVGRLSWEKGVDYLIKSWPTVLKEVPSARLILVGEWDKRETDIKSKIEELIKNNRLSDTVKFKGALPHDQVLTEISKSEIFICPSLAEGLGIVFIEAQACGTPPIGTKVGGIPDVIENNENGLLIEPKNSSQIAETIIKLLKDKELADRLSQRGLETVKKFDWKIVIDKIDALYQE